MSIRHTTWISAIAALVAIAPARADVIVNIDAATYGYQESSTVPSLGQSVTPISEASGGAFNQVTLTAGVYQVTNARGNVGAIYDAFQYSQATGVQNWTWNFLATNASDGNKAVLFGNGSDVTETRAEAAANAAGYVGTFTLTSDATLNFMIRDNLLGDNSGGVSLLITQTGTVSPPVATGPDPAAVPEPAALAMLALGAILPAGFLARRRRAG